MLDQKGKVNLFTRPRRFGKTLTISMLQYFFENLKQDKSYLFNGLRIQSAGEDYLAHQNQYPVIKLTLKGTGKLNFDDAFEKLKESIAVEYDRHRYLLTTSQIEKEHRARYQRLLIQVASVNEYASSLKFLSECLEKHHGQKVIIFIDEYDVPLEKSHFNGYYHEMVDFIRSFFDDGLKTNDSLAFALMTGCLRVSKESIFTGMNNLNTVSILSDNYGEYFGFTEPEVGDLLKYYHLEHQAGEMRDWYNGYLFGETTVYNPWSSMKYLSDILYSKIPFPVAHWSNTSSNDIVRKLIDIADDGTKDEIERLIQGEIITKPIHEDIVYSDILKNMNNLWNFLYFTGYLKKVGKKQMGVENYFDLMIPNKEILSIYVRQMREWFDERVQEVDLTHLYTAVLNRDVATFEDELNEILGETISYMDSHESFYHGFLTGVLRGIKGYVAKSNRESGDGRGDIFIKPRDLRKPAIVIEVKMADHVQHLEKASDAALLQIEQKRYNEELALEGYTQTIKYGIAFYRKRCMVKGLL